MWLRDGLPKDLHGIRTIIYGYDTRLVESKSFKSTFDIARDFANRLVSVGFGWPSAKPTIFLCHSLGGIIFKETVVILAGALGQGSSFLEKLRATLFFGVPNVGMEITQLRTMVKGEPTEQLIEDLAPRSSRLSELDFRFSGHQAKSPFRVVSFYETETTKTVQVSFNHCNNAQSLIYETVFGRSLGSGWSRSCDGGERVGHPKMFSSPRRGALYRQGSFCDGKILSRRRCLHPRCRVFTEFSETRRQIHGRLARTNDRYKLRE